MWLKSCCTDLSIPKTSWKCYGHRIICCRVIVGVSAYKWGFSGHGHVAIVTGGGSNIANQFLSVSVITGGTNENVSNNVKIFLFSRNHITLTCIIYNKIHLKLIDTRQTKWAGFTWFDHRKKDNKMIYFLLNFISPT